MSKELDEALIKALREQRDEYFEFTLGLLERELKLMRELTEKLNEELNEEDARANEGDRQYDMAKEDI